MPEPGISCRSASVRAEQETAQDLQPQRVSQGTEHVRGNAEVRVKDVWQRVLELPHHAAGAGAGSGDTAAVGEAAARVVAREARPGVLRELVQEPPGAAVGLGRGGLNDDPQKTTPSAGRTPAASVATPGGLLRWIAAHPDHAGLVILPDEGRPTVSFNAGRRFPLPSTRKVLIAGAAVAHGALRGSVSRATVEHFYAPGTDGGAHASAHLDGERLPLHEVAQAAIEQSDNAAADTVLSRVGARRVDAWARAQGMTEQDPIYPLLGEYAAWARDKQWTQQSPRTRAVQALSLARSVSAKQVRVPGLGDQQRLARVSVAGTPAEWAQLMRRIARHGAPELRELLDWPKRRSPKAFRSFSAVLAKGGTQVGTMTEADYLKPKGKPGTAMVLFLRDLPTGVQQSLQQSFANQKLLLQLVLDPKLTARARQLLRR